MNARRRAFALSLAAVLVWGALEVRADDGSVAPANAARALADVAARIAPTVVTLHVKRYVPTLRTADDLKRRRDRHKRAEEARDKREGARRAIEWATYFRYCRRPAGPVSGVMVRRDGLVLTSKFNVQGPVRSIHVELADGRVFPGEVLGWESDLDLAAVRVKAPRDVRFAALPVRERKEPAPGTLITVVGGSWGPVRYTATAGMVSALDRLGGVAIQLAAKLNYGNTGGAVVNLEGRLVGIACHVHPDPVLAELGDARDLPRGLTGLNSGVGFATAAHRLHEALPRLERGERAPATSRPVIGIIPGMDAKDRRLYIARVDPGSGAERGGLEVGDLLISIGGVPIRDRGDVKLALARARVGQVVTVVVNRDGVTRELAVRLGTAD